MLKPAYKSGYGAQFGGKYFALDVRIIRLPRHGASCPVGMGVHALPIATSRRKSIRTASGSNNSNVSRAA